MAGINDENVTLENENAVKEKETIQMSCLDILNIQGLAKTDSFLNSISNCFGHYKLQKGVDEFGVPFHNV
jgi:hypothetical protein